MPVLPLTAEDVELVDPRFAGGRARLAFAALRLEFQRGIVGVVVLVAFEDEAERAVEAGAEPARLGGEDCGPDVFADGPVLGDVRAGTPGVDRAPP